MLTRIYLTVITLLVALLISATVHTTVPLPTKRERKHSVTLTKPRPVDGTSNAIDAAIQRLNDTYYRW